MDYRHGLPVDYMDYGMDYRMSKLDELRAMRERHLMAEVEPKAVAKPQAGTCSTYKYRDPQKRRAQVRDAVRRHRAKV
jgi:hypothetical protein